MESEPQGIISRIAAFSYDNRVKVVIAWVVLLVVTLAASKQFSGEWDADYATPGSDSKAALELIEKDVKGQSVESVTVVWESARGARSKQAKSAVDRLIKGSVGLEGIGAAQPARYSPDGKIGVTELALNQRPWAVPKESGVKIIELAEENSRDGVEINLSGPVIQNASSEFSPEVASLALAGLILLVTFGSVVATLIPLWTAIMSLGITTSLIPLLANLVDIPDWSLFVAGLIGLGVGIDYALLIITRYRLGIHEGLSARDSVINAMSTAGRSSVVAGGTVVVALLGMCLMRISFMYGVALACSLAVLVVVAAAMTLVPATLGLVGKWIEKLHVPGIKPPDPNPTDTRAARWARFVQRHPWASIVGSVCIAVALALPVATLNLGFPDEGNDRPESTTRKAFDAQTRAFGVGGTQPILVVTKGLSSQRSAELIQEIKKQKEVRSVVPVPGGKAAKSGESGTQIINVFGRHSQQSEESRQLVRDIRSKVVSSFNRKGEELHVGGIIAASLDQANLYKKRLPAFIGGVLALSFLLLIVSFRSPLVAIKAGVMNLLSVGVAYGVVAYAAQGGWLGTLLGIDGHVPVPAFLPIMMFSILFGLSMDYEVFLISRIREQVNEGIDTATAVTRGIATTARVITAAALIMISVFLMFVLMPDSFTRLMGLGMATAILVDATIVRMVLVPALMQLMGEWNWWIPKWLDRIIPDLEHQPGAHGSK